MLEIRVGIRKADASGNMRPFRFVILFTFRHILKVIKSCFLFGCCYFVPVVCVFLFVFLFHFAVLEIRVGIRKADASGNMRPFGFVVLFTFRHILKVIKSSFKFGCCYFVPVACVFLFFFLFHFHFAVLEIRVGIRKANASGNMRPFGFVVLFNFRHILKVIKSCFLFGCCYFAPVVCVFLFFFFFILPCWKYVWV